MNSISLVNFNGELVDFYKKKTLGVQSICSSCGYEYQNYLSSGLLGCSKCYDIFHDLISKQVNVLRVCKKITTQEFSLQKIQNINNLVVTSRVRMARNLEGLPFKTKIKGAFDAMATTVQQNNSGFVSTAVATLQSAMANALYEQHLISKDLLANKINSIIVARHDNKVVVMLGEEDHARIQSIFSGFDLDTAYTSSKKISDDLVHEHSVAWRKDFGFLTSCPTNLGTGMRASVMMFLPALTLTGKMQHIMDQLEQRHITVRGVYGEGSDAGGYMYQISNQACFGMTEEQIIDAVKSVTVEIAQLEFTKQEQIFKSERDQIINGVMRAWGLLTNAYMLTSSEAVENLALLKLGSCLGILKFKQQGILDDLFFIIQPQTLMTTDRIGNIADRDKLRARRVAEHLRSSRVI